MLVETKNKAERPDYIDAAFFFFIGAYCLYLVATNGAINVVATGPIFFQFPSYAILSMVALLAIQLRKGVKLPGYGKEEARRHEEETIKHENDLYSRVYLYVWSMIMMSLWVALIPAGEAISPASVVMFAVSIAIALYRTYPRDMKTPGIRQRLDEWGNRINARNWSCQLANLIFLAAIIIFAAGMDRVSELYGENIGTVIGYFFIASLMAALLADPDFGNYWKVFSVSAVAIIIWRAAAHLMLMDTSQKILLVLSAVYFYMAYYELVRMSYKKKG